MENLKTYSYVKLKHDSLYINQRIELFLILTDGGYKDKTLFVPGTIRPGYTPQKSERCPEGYVRVLSNPIKYYLNTFRGMWTKYPRPNKIFNTNPEVKPIGAFVVRKLK